MKNDRKRTLQGMEDDGEYVLDNDAKTDPTLTRCIAALEARGYHAGRRGTVVPIPESLIGAFAQRYLERHWNGKRITLAKKRAQAIAIEAERDLASREFEAEQAASKRINTEFEIYPHRYSPSIGWLFIVLSIVLFFTDLPLSMMLVADIFDLPVKNLNAPFVDILATIARQSWEVVFLSIGIAIFPVVIKIPYQYFVSPSEANKGNKPRRLFAIVMVVAVAITLATLVSLALLRSELREKKIYEREQQSVAENNRRAEAAGEVIPKKGPIQNASANPWISQLSFVLLTLTLPILATIAFSEGVANVQRKRAQKSSSERLATLRNTYLEVVKAAAEVKEQLRFREESLTNETATEAWKEIAFQQAIGIYEKAHEHGRSKWIEEFKGRSLYETMLLNASHELSPAGGNAFADVTSEHMQ